MREREREGEKERERERVDWVGKNGSAMVLHKREIKNDASIEDNELKSLFKHLDNRNPNL